MSQARRRMLIIALFGGAVLTILAVGFVSFNELRALSQAGTRVQRSYELLQTLDDLTAALTDTETSQRGYLLTEDPSYLTQYEDAIAQIRLAITELRRLSDDDPATQSAIAHLVQLAGARLDELQESIHAAQLGRHHAAIANVVDGAGRRLMRAFRHDSDELETMQRHVLDLRRERARRARLASEIVLVTTVVLSLMLAGAAALISRRFDERRRMLENEIAERRRAEEYRESLLVSERAAREEAERATRLKDEFVATLSHELRTPLNAIVGWASILRRDGRPETLTQGVEVIERNAKAQAQMIEDLLDMSRILSGKLLFEPRPMELAVVVEAAIAAMRPTADVKGVLLTSTGLVRSLVNGDPARLQQVTWNLLANAIKFTPRGGKVAVRLTEAAGQVEMLVSDSGQGIKADFLPYVFDRFRQADASTTRRHGGLGLGLSIVKSVVEMHGGSVEAHSPGEGEGARFVVRLPIAQKSQRDLDAARTPPPPVLHSAMPSLNGLRILVVDDEVDARALAQRVLEERGALVLTAGSAKEALATVGGSADLSVLVSDIGMPDHDGYELIRRMRALPGAVGQIPAVALTALARSEDRARALQAGYQRHITKPVDPAELVSVIATVAQRAYAGMR